MRKVKIICDLYVPQLIFRYSCFSSGISVIWMAYSIAEIVCHPSSLRHCHDGMIVPIARCCELHWQMVSEKGYLQPFAVCVDYLKVFYSIYSIYILFIKHLFVNKLITAIVSLCIYNTIICTKCCNHKLFGQLGKFIIMHCAVRIFVIIKGTLFCSAFR